MIAFHLRDSELAWIRKLCGELGMGSIMNENPDRIVWKALQEIYKRHTKAADKIDGLEKTLHKLSKRVKDLEK